MSELVNVGPFPFEGHDEFGGCTSGRGASHGTELFGDPKFALDMPDDDGIIAENLFGDFGSDRVGYDPNDDAHIWFDAAEGYATIEDILEFDDEADEDEEDEEDEFEATSSLYPSDCYINNVRGTRFFADSDMEPARKETVRGRRQKRATEVRVRGNNHPKRCRPFLVFKAGNAKQCEVHPCTLHLPR